MFNNRFTQKDPLVEAVQNAQREGQIRRQAEAIVNEAFDVYSRKAVVNELVAAYDAAVEDVIIDLKEGVQIDEISKGLAGRYIKKASDQMADAAKYKSKYEKGKDDVSKERTKQWSKVGGKRRTGVHDATDKLTGRARVHATEETDIDEAKASWEKEGSWSKQMKRQERAYLNSQKRAKKDYDKDGKVESPKDEVIGSRLKAAKEAGRLEELSDDLIKRYHRKAVDKFHTGEETPERRSKGRMMATQKRFGGMMGIKKAKVPATGIKEEQLDEISVAKTRDYLSKASVAQKQKRAQLDRINKDSPDIYKGDKEWYDYSNAHGQRGPTFDKNEKLKTGMRLAKRKLNPSSKVKVHATEETQIDELYGKGSLGKIAKHYSDVSSSFTDETGRSTAMRDRANILKKKAEVNAGKRDIPSPSKQKATDRYYKKLKQMTHEETQIDEVSKSTLGSYIKKASHDVATKSALTRGHAMKSDDDRKNQDYMGARKHDELSNKMFDKSWKRRKGIAKAVDKLTSEEHIDEEKQKVTVRSGGTVPRGLVSKPQSDRKPYSQWSDEEKQRHQEYTDKVVAGLRRNRRLEEDHLEEAPIVRKKSLAKGLLSRIAQRKSMKEDTQLDELSAFGSAFAAARKAGQSDFKWGNKTITTQLKSPSTSSSSGVSGVPTPPKRIAANLPGDNASRRDNFYKDNGIAPGSSAPKPEPKPTVASLGRSADDFEKNVVNSTNVPTPPRREAPEQNPSQKLTSWGSNNTNVAKSDVDVKNKQNKEAGAINQNVAENKLNESVQVGDRTYRIF